MYAVAVLNSEALAAFRSEYPWLDFPEDICEVSLFLDDNRAPTRLTAFKQDALGARHAANVDDFGVETILALVRYAPQVGSKLENSPEEARFWSLLENLPIADGVTPIEEVEEQRRLKLEAAYRLTRQIAVEQFDNLMEADSVKHDAARLQKLIAQLPETLSAVDEGHKSLFLEVDLWRLVAVLRDELSLPADYDLIQRDDADGYSPAYMEQAEAAAMSDPVIQVLFDLSPVAFSISTIGQNTSRYIRVNKAYLDLVGHSWENIRGHEMVASGVVVGSEKRAYRLMLLDRDAGYDGQIAEIHNAAGETVPVSISARRLFVAGQFYDFEVLTRVAEA
ncbi:diguanylate cyclase [Rhizobium sp. SL42]|uniref:diguanylate cyclase n=1 Tax=Rhizobium sp. SL42 TaxID=2806346 RepID=UPI001F3950FE|nr:diguanylate cyclase [Rhizobium sp. SL42]UJW74991.1 diguanylate cyclase [Rhizobium sp. SL42]